MRYTQYRGGEKVKAEATLRFACMNLKKLAKWKRIKGLLKPYICVFIQLYARMIQKAVAILNFNHFCLQSEAIISYETIAFFSVPSTALNLTVKVRYSKMNFTQNEKISQVTNITLVPEDIYAELRIMNENRMRINREMIAIENRIKRWFAIYFPEYKNVFGNWDCDSSIEVLINAPLPVDAVNMGAEAINGLWRAKKIRAVGMKRANLLVETAKSSVGVKHGASAARCEISMLIEDYLRKKEQMQRVVEILETLCIQVPNAEKLLNIKGVGILTVESFFGEVGDIRRFDSPKQIQKLAGLAITENSSGKYKGRSCISKRRRKLLRYTLFQAVMSMTMHLPEFRELHRYYTTRDKNPLKGKQSKVALCCKVIRVFYTLLKKGVEYDSQNLMKDIVRPALMAA